ncbi:uncharacterized protein LOC121652895 [Melanotaenia boesemani]|uniref:uncharacterized protein LOC121652895 n=1 Tax=Melanotaenia boesemani TaxID=1250792 RepID=UPI001C04A890|nr:uncharacterized protein LOC121652895 [Melanotaenia boesemani]
MFSESGTPAPGEQKGFKPHTHHFIPWLRNSLKTHHSSGDLGLNRPYKSSSEPHNNLTPLEKAKGIGFFSIQGKDRAKKGDLRCNGIGMLPVVLRGHHILPGSLGKQREDGPARWNQTKELDTDYTGPGDGPQGLSDSSSVAQDNHNFVKNHRSHSSLRKSQNDRTSTSVRKYGPLVGPPPTPVSVLPAEEPECKVPVVVLMEDRKGKVWDYTSHTTYRQRDLHSSSWLSSDTQGLIERQHGFSYINKHSRNSQSQRDLTVLREPPVEGFNGPLNGLIFSTQVPHRGLGCSTTVRGPRKPRPNSERIAILGQNQTWVQQRPNSEGKSQRKEAGCNRKVVRNQIKRVVDNLELVLKALRDVQQEMKEVVQQIDYLTSSIDLNDLNEEQQTSGGDRAKPANDSSYSSSSSSSEVTVGITHRRPSEAENQPRAVDSYGTLRRDHHSKSQSPQKAQLCPITSGFLSERSRPFRLSYGPVSSLNKGEPLPYTNNTPPSNPPQLQNITFHDHTQSSQGSLPARPPTPGLSPLTVNLHHPGSPGSRPHSPETPSSLRMSPVSPPSPLSPKLYPPPALSPSVIIDTKVEAFRTPQSDLPSAGPLSPSFTHPLSVSCPPTDSDTPTMTVADTERRASSAGPAATAKPPVAQGRRGRKPPPYPHKKLSEITKKVNEPRKAPPYPEKRRLLSTTV